MALLAVALLLPFSVAQRSFKTQNWQGAFEEGSGVLQSLTPTETPDFDFSPSDFFSLRNDSGNYHTGDIGFRWRNLGCSVWSTFDTAQLRSETPEHTYDSGSLLHSDYSKISPEITGKLSIVRDWKTVDSDLVLQASIGVPRDGPGIELGSFGFPIEFNSIFTLRRDEEMTMNCSLAEPYIGLDAGYLQVMRLTGTGPNLIITPHGKGSKFEGWRFLREETTEPLEYASNSFEGFYSWEVLTKAYAENEWSATKPWNPPTSITIQPGETYQFGLRFTPSQNVYDTESTLSSIGMPVAVGLPGYVIPAGVQGKLLVKYGPAITAITAEPAGSLNIAATTVPNPSWKAYKVTAGYNAFGRVLVTIHYADNKTQTVNYFVTTDTITTGRRFADFYFKESYFTDLSDPFSRYGIVSYDTSANKQVLEDSRVYIVGQADEAGSVYVGVSLQQSSHPDPSHVSRLEDMVERAIWGNLQNEDYSVKHSLFFYEPAAVPGYTYGSNIDWSESWDKDYAYSTSRTYDYVHVSSIYYSLYRAERVSPGVLKLKNASWYLNQSSETVIASQNNTDFADLGLMGETLWLHILEDLTAEGFTNRAAAMRDVMQWRQQVWASRPEPFGSEMSWDSTGQEGVYAWSKYFDDQATADKTLRSIRGYMFTIPHWGYNGNARRFWDFKYGGKVARVERMIHHYGSTLNALPLLDNYKYNANPAGPAAFYDLRVGYGGLMGPLTNINAAGATSTAFHAQDDTLAWDAYSGDYGPTYLGHILGSACYLVEHPDFGWVAMGGNIVSTNPIIVTPYDSVRRRLYIAGMGLEVEFDAGRISTFSYDTVANILEVQLVQAEQAPACKTVMMFRSTLGKTIALQTKEWVRSKGGYVVDLPGSVTFSL